MLKTDQKYLQKIKVIFQNFIDKNPNVKIFIFGSSLVTKDFNDIDMAIEGKFSQNDLNALKEILEESTLPFIFDIINLNLVSPDFKNNIMNQPILWIKH